MKIFLLGRSRRTTTSCRRRPAAACLGYPIRVGPRGTPATGRCRAAHYHLQQPCRRVEVAARMPNPKKNAASTSDGIYHRRSPSSQTSRAKLGPATTSCSHFPSFPSVACFASSVSARYSSSITMACLLASLGRVVHLESTRDGADHPVTRRSVSPPSPIPSAGACCGARPANCLIPPSTDEQCLCCASRQGQYTTTVPDRRQQQVRQLCLA